MVKGITKVEAPDDYTVVFTLEDADASFLVKTTSNAYCILDSEVVKQHGGSDSGSDTAKAWLDTTSAGSGPFVIEKWTPKEQLVLKKNDKYWGTASNIDSIIIKEMTSVDAQITALKNGEIDISLGLDSETAKQLDGVENVSVATGTTALETFLVMSVTISPAGYCRAQVSFSAVSVLCAASVTKRVKPFFSLRDAKSENLPPRRV